MNLHQTQLSENLIRQYFEKNNLTKSLAEFNKVATTATLPPTALINKKTRKVAKTNKERPNPYKSLLEALVDHVSDSGRLLEKKIEKMSKEDEEDLVTYETLEEWTTEEVSRFNKGLQIYDSSYEKNERFNLLSKYIGSRSKRECYEAYKSKEKDSSKESNKGDMKKSDSSSSSIIFQKKVKNEDDGAKKSSFSTSKTSMAKNMEVNDIDTVEFSSSTKSSIQVEDFESADESKSPAFSPSKLNNSRGYVKPPLLPSKRVGIDNARTIKKIYFGEGKKKELSDHWTKQGFFFTDVKNLKYGLVQLEGGPCGVIASVQAFVLKHLLFVAGASFDNNLWQNPASYVQENCLIEALSEILWQAKSGPSVSVCISNSGSESRSGDISEYPCYLIDSLDTLKSFFGYHKEKFTEEKGQGVYLFIISLILTRGIENVLSDMDSGGLVGTLMSNHDYAGQELVNLLLFGRAHSNVFDNVKKISDDTGKSKDEMVLKGVPSRGEVGFLTLFEHYGHVEVGNFSKNPKYSIWVICSESHYSVLFGLSLTNQLKFDIYYFDPLARQDENIRLTLSLSESDKLKAVEEEKKNHLIPPLNQVIRTKWKEANVSWNNSDPLL